MVAPYLHYVDEYVLVAEQESRENLVIVLSVYFPDYSFQKLLHTRVVTETVFSHVDDAVQVRHLFYNISFNI